MSTFDANNAENLGEVLGLLRRGERTLTLSARPDRETVRIEMRGSLEIWILTLLHRFAVKAVEQAQVCFYPLRAPRTAALRLTYKVLSADVLEPHRIRSPGEDSPDKTRS